MWPKLASGDHVALEAAFVTASRRCRQREFRAGVDEGVVVLPQQRGNRRSCLLTLTPLTNYRHRWARDAGVRVISSLQPV
jgi:hypothetical protein